MVTDEGGGTASGRNGAFKGEGGRGDVGGNPSTVESRYNKFHW